MTPSFVVPETPDALAGHIARWPAEQVMATQDGFALALSGGSTPKAQGLWREAVSWNRMGLCGTVTIFAARAAVGG